MNALSEDQLSSALRTAVPEPGDAPGRAAAARTRAARLRTRRRLAVGVAAVAGALAIGVPVLLGPGGRAGGDGGAGPAGATHAPTRAADPCAQHGCTPAAVLAAVRHPLHLPHLSAGQACPVSAVRRFPGGAGFSGPFKAIGAGPLGLTGGDVRTRTVSMTPGPGSWQEQKVIWVVDRRYAGPLLLRGGRIDRPGALWFEHYLGAVDTGGGQGVPHPKLVYVREGLHPKVNLGLQSFPSGIYVHSAGCYALQVDGVGFSETVVFRASTP